MYKFLAVVAILGLTACGSKSAESVPADSTAVVITADTTKVVDSVVVDSTAK